MAFALILEVRIEARWEAMMKAMHCGELMKGCDFVARGATEDEVMKKAAEHAKTAHGIDNITPELAESESSDQERVADPGSKKIC